MPSGAKENRLIVALDVDNYEQAASLVEKLESLVTWFKVGSVLFTREGPKVCKLVKDAGARLFLDLKFHDIPNTVHGAVLSAFELDADMLTLHLAGGEAMIREALRAKEEKDKWGVLIVGVTVLTHLSADDFRSLYVSDRSLEETVLALAKMARRAGLDGVVSSVDELPLIRRHLGPDFVVITPGIRLARDGVLDDQARVATPARAIRGGADYIVVGRPITADPDPVAACTRILENMGPR